MSQSRGKLQRQEAASIAINGKRLDTVEMCLPPYENVISHRLYPAHRVKMAPYGGGLRMQMPAPLALELYRTGVIPQGESQRFSLSIDGREEGVFQVIDFRHDNSDGREMVQMTLARVRGFELGADSVTDDSSQTRFRT